MVLFQDIISYYPCKSIPQSVYFHHVAMKNLRETFRDMTPDEMREASREAEIAEWREGNRFCGRCGAEMKPHYDPSERALGCA